jgi:hypothetical protein
MSTIVPDGAEIPDNIHARQMGDFVDLRRELAGQLYNALEVDEIDPASSEYYRRLPAPDPENYPEVFVHNEHAAGWTPAHEWHVAAGLSDVFDCDYEEAQQLMNALGTAIYQAKILNAKHAYQVPMPDIVRGDAPWYLVRTTETRPVPRVSYSLNAELVHLVGKAPGYTWGDDELPDFDTRFEYLGRFEMLSDSVIDGRSYAIMTEVASDAITSSRRNSA